MTEKQFVITKKIAKHDTRAIIVVSKILKEQFQHGMIAQITIKVAEGGKNANL